jgi:hypothetical protein
MNLCDNAAVFKIELQLFNGRLETGKLSKCLILQPSSAKCILIASGRAKIWFKILKLSNKIQCTSLMLKNTMTLFTNPVLLNAEISVLEPNLQQELTDVKCSLVISKFMEFSSSPVSKDMIQF